MRLIAQGRGGLLKKLYRDVARVGVWSVHADESDVNNVTFEIEFDYTVTDKYWLESSNEFDIYLNRNEKYWYWLNAPVQYNSDDLIRLIVNSKPQIKNKD